MDCVVILNTRKILCLNLTRKTKKKAFLARKDHPNSLALSEPNQDDPADGEAELRWEGKNEENKVVITEECRASVSY